MRPNRRASKPNARVPYRGARPKRRQRNAAADPGGSPLLWILLPVLVLLAVVGGYRLTRPPAADDPGGAGGGVTVQLTPPPEPDESPVEPVEEPFDDDPWPAASNDSPLLSFPSGGDGGGDISSHIESQKPAPSPGPRSPAIGKTVSVATPPATAGNLFTMALSGTLGGEALDASDKQTWARIAYAMQSEAPAAHRLVFPGGKVPSVQPPAGAGKSKAKAAAAVPWTGDPDRPRFRLLVDARSTKEGGITFYGNNLGQRYRCQINATIQELEGSDYVYLDSALHVEEYTPSQDQDPEQKILRKVYDAALDRFVKELVKAKPFAGK